MPKPYGYQSSIIGVAVKDNWAFAIFNIVGAVGAEINGVLPVNLTDPYSPTLTGWVAFVPYLPFEIKVEGDYAYVADTAGGLEIIDLTDPSRPSRVAYCDTAGIASGLAIIGERVYMATNTGGLAVCDIRFLANKMYLPIVMYK